MFARTFRPAASMARSTIARGKSTFTIPASQLNSSHKSEIATVSAVFIAFLVAGAVASKETAYNISSARANQEL
jgi:hypothetical protein